MKKFIEKLISCLKEWSFEAEIVIPGSDGYDDTVNREIICTKNAIDIVNQLAEEYNNGVCEWYKVKNGNAYKCHTHAEIHDSRVLDWCVCPYCGKKIIIAPYQPKGE